MAAERKLTPKQERFIQEYLIDCNATGAARRAGYSEKTANEQGARLLANVNIQQLVQKRQAKLAEKAEVTQEWIVAKLKRIAERSTDERNLLNWNPSAANRSLELLGTQLGMFGKKVELTGKDGDTIKSETKIIVEYKRSIAEASDDSA